MFVIFANFLFTYNKNLLPKKIIISIQNLREGGWTCKGVFRGGGGSGGSKFSDFFKCEGKKLERKRKKMKRDGGGGLIQLNC